MIFFLLPNKLLKASDTFPIRLANLVNNTNIPPPAKPANTSPIDTFSVIQPNAFPIASPILLKAFPTQLAMEERFFFNPSIPPVAFSNAFDMPSTPLDKPSSNDWKPVPFSTPSFQEVKKSPMEAAKSKSISPKLPTPSEPSNRVIGERTNFIPFPIRSNAENTPLEARLILSKVSSVGFKPSENSFILVVKSYSCSPVAGGNTSLNASLIGFITLINASKEFFNASIIFSLPDDLAIFLAKSSADIVPSCNPLLKASNSVSVS